MKLLAILCIFQILKSFSLKLLTEIIHISWLIKFFLITIFLQISVWRPQCHLALLYCYDFNAHWRSSIDCLLLTKWNIICRFRGTYVMINLKIDITCRLHFIANQSSGRDLYCITCTGCYCKHTSVYHFYFWAHLILFSPSFS